MQIEDYFEFIAPDEIKLKGHRIWIEHVLEEYLLRDMTLEEVVKRFETLSKEQILAVLLYYHHNKVAMDKYMTDWVEFCRVSEQQHREQHAERYDRIRKALTERRAEQQKQAAS